MPGRMAGRAEKLESYLDLPWCRADLFYIQKLVYCAEVRGKIAWQDLHQF